MDDRINNVVVRGRRYEHRMLDAGYPSYPSPPCLMLAAVLRLRLEQQSAWVNGDSDSADSFTAPSVCLVSAQNSELKEFRFYISRLLFSVSPESGSLPGPPRICSHEIINRCNPQP